jgi:hypothetical protein
VNKHSEVVKYNTSFFGVNLHVRKCMPYIILSISFGNFMAFLYCLHYCILTALLNSVLRTLWPFKSCKLSLTAIVFTHLSEYMWFFVLSLGADHHPRKVRLLHHPVLVVRSMIDTDGTYGVITFLDLCMSELLHWFQMDQYLVCIMCLHVYPLLILST